MSRFTGFNEDKRPIHVENTRFQKYSDLCVCGLDLAHFYLVLEVEGFKCTKTKTHLTPGMTVETTPGTIGTCNNMTINIRTKIIAVMAATFAVAKRTPEKFQVCTRFELSTSGIPVQTLPIELTSQLGEGY